MHNEGQTVQVFAHDMEMVLDLESMMNPSMSMCEDGERDDILRFGRNPHCTSTL